MSTLHTWLASGLLGCGATGLVTSLLHAPQRVSVFARHAAMIDVNNARMLKPPSGMRMLRAQIGLATALAVLAGLTQQPLCVTPSLLLALMIPVWQQRMLDKRKEVIELQLDGWLMGLTSALRASPALGEAIDSTIPLVQGAMRDELALVIRKFRLGTPLDEGLTDMARRVGSPALASAITTLRIARRTGGELAATLEKSADALREMARLEGVVRTQTASGRTQAMAISALPLPMIALLHYLNPDYLDPLFTTPLGNAMGALALLLWIVAAVWAHKIVQVDL